MTRHTAMARIEAQEIADRESMFVHVGCGGEVTSEPHGRLRCHCCDLAVDDDDVVSPWDGE